MLTNRHSCSSENKSPDKVLAIATIPTIPKPRNQFLRAKIALEFSIYNILLNFTIEILDDRTDFIADFIVFITVGNKNNKIDLDI